MYQCQLGRSQPKEKGWTSAALVMTAEMSDMEVEKYITQMPFVTLATNSMPASSTLWYHEQQCIDGKPKRYVTFLSHFFA